MLMSPCKGFLCILYKVQFVTKLSCVSFTNSTLARKTPQAHNLASYPLIAQYGMMLSTPYQLPADSNFNDSNIALKKKGRPPETFHICSHTLGHPEFVQKPLGGEGESQRKFLLLLNWKYIPMYACWVNGKGYNSLKNSHWNRQGFYSMGSEGFISSFGQKHCSPGVKL